MKLLRCILYPLALFYGLVVAIRNFLFDRGILKTHTISMPSIGVGNLSSGGTGKSIVIDYLIVLLKKTHSISVLSRGYKRETSGVVVGTANSSAAIIGDEPLQFLKKHPSITVVVAEKRILGLNKIKEITPLNTIVLLDDIMQHRYVKPSLLIITTTFNKPYFSDYLLPTGNLRESPLGAKRANVILVTKCPDTISNQDIDSFKEKCFISEDQYLFFTKIKYSSYIFNRVSRLLLSKLTSSVLLITGISDPSPMVEFLNKEDIEYTHLAYPDHHTFTTSDIQEIHKQKGESILLTTEKDMTRLKPFIKESYLYYLPIEMVFLHSSEKAVFETLVLNEASNIV
jgi:tetraacyldisaccharide 4'-kinase